MSVYEQKGFDDTAWHERQAEECRQWDEDFRRYRFEEVDPVGARRRHEAQARKDAAAHHERMILRYSELASEYEVAGRHVDAEHHRLMAEDHREALEALRAYI
jgi:hypothetical protein